MQDAIQKLVKGEYESLDARTLLHNSPSVLLGVSDETAEVLKLISIHTVFDLASSTVFNHALEISEALDGKVSITSQHGFVPADAVNSAHKNTPITDLVDEDIQVLNGVGSSKKEKIIEAIQLETIRDFSYWPPFQAARQIISIAFGGDSVDEDKDSPPELLPKAGEHATEKAFYSSIFFDEIYSSEVNETEFLSLEANQVDVAALGYSQGFETPATGAILTFEQAWYPESLSLGQLLHSLALAPAESTRIAVIDWSRQTSSSTAEEISQSESLSNELGQRRAIGETVRATARQNQSGRSRVEGNSNSSSGSVSAGASGGAFGFSVSVGASYSAASNNYESSSVSSSKGSRSVAADTNQSIDARTQQASASVRNRRAAIVREVSQSESEKIQTRVVTNYNHSHALSIHYYEVVQIYRTITRLVKYERCIFIPMKQIDFRDGKVLYHYREILRRSVPPAYRGIFNQLQGQVSILRNTMIVDSPPLGETPSGRDIRENQTWNIDVGSRLKGLSVRQGLEALAKIRVILNNDEKDIHEYEGSRSEIRFEDGYEIGEIRRIEAVWKKVDETVWKNKSKKLELSREGNITVGFNYLEIDTVFQFVQHTPFEVPTPLHIKFAKEGNEEESRDLITVEQPKELGNLSDKLNEDTAYYSRLIWLNLASHEVALLLSNYTFNDKRLIEYVDTQPLTVYGNYLVLKYYDEDDEEWQNWKEKHIDTAKVTQQKVPVATGGTFAEAVLGRFNASEKLDITRFWNWQESPIPIQAPDIAPIQSGSRKEADNTTPGRLDAPVVNIMNPPNLPDPQGMGAVLNAVSSSNLFKDMSGLAATASLAQQSVKSSGEGATAAAAQAGQNMKVAADLEKARLDMLSKLLGGSLSKSGVSKIGALLNHGSKLDEKGRKKSNQNAESPAFPNNQSSQLGASSSGNGCAVNHGNVTSGSPGGSHEVDAFKSAVGSDLNFAASNPTLSWGSNSLPNLSAWEELISFRPLHSVQSAMIVAQHKLQPIEKARSQVSLDYYPVEIRKFPKIKGKVVTAEEFLTYFRLNINQFANPHAQFNPYDSAASTLWKSKKPLDTVISINLAKVHVDTSRGEPPWGIPTGDGKLTLEKGSVVVSEFTSTHWNFMTVKTTNDGWHPISGTRQFGIKKKDKNGSYVLYTRGADRITLRRDLAANWLSSWIVNGGIVFTAADILWVSMQNSVAAYINANGGSAVVGKKMVGRYDWPAVKTLYFKPKRTWLEDAIASIPVL